MTLAEYLAFEDSSPVRHEFVAGDVYAMTGGTLRHQQVLLNVASSLRAAARGGPCRVYPEARLRIGDDVVYYPDATVVCDPSDDDMHAVRRPCLVVEVASPSTQRVDRQEKLDAYRAIPTVRAYLIVEQRFRIVEYHWRDDSGGWHHETLIASGRMALPCPEVTLSLDEIYEGVTTEALREPEAPAYAVDGAEGVPGGAEP